MRRFTLALSAVCLLFTPNQPAQALVSSPSQFGPGVNTTKLVEQASIRWVSVTQIENSLTGRPSMAAEFDIDDTALFFSPGFWRGRKMYSPGSEDYLKNPAFWEKMNNGWDEFSIPKGVAHQLIGIHMCRDDSTFFVAERSQTKTGTMSGTLSGNFHILTRNIDPVIFAGDKPGQNTKTQWLQDKNICIFYGDSNNDITATRDVSIHGTRVLRASNSTYGPLPQADVLGKEMIVNLEY